MKEVTGKTAFITGGANGIGLGMAEAFCEAGMSVMIADIRPDSLETAKSHLSRFENSVQTILLDVTDREAFAEAADKTEKIFGKIHVLCNNAGINVFGPPHESSYDDWDWIIDVNLKGVVNGLKCFIPKILSHGEGGHIVNTASMSAFIVTTTTGAYTATKYAVRGLSEVLWYHMAPHNIGVSILSPGFVATHIHHCEELRPQRYKDAANPITGETAKKMDDMVHPAAMKPFVAGEMVLEAIKQNKMYIFTHPDSKEEVRENCEEILAAFPEEDPKSKSKEFEDARWQELKKIKEQYGPR